jgi:hypothetical protein
MGTDSPIEDGKTLTRGGFIKLLGAAFVTTLFSESSIGKQININDLVEVNPDNNSEILSSSKIQLKLSEKPGIVDIYHDGNLLNNMVPLLRFDIGGQRHFNNAEIQGEKNKFVLRVFKNLARSNEAYLLYTYDQDENSPAIHPAANQVVLFKLETRNNGDVSILPQSITNKEGVRTQQAENINLGWGMFAGFLYQTKDVTAQVVNPDNLKETEIVDIPFAEPSVSSETHGLGYFPPSTENVTAVEISSYDSKKSPIRLIMENSLMGRFDLSNSTASLQTEVRDTTWDPTQKALADELKQLSGRNSWIESVILWPNDKMSPITLSLSA